MNPDHAPSRDPARIGLSVLVLALAAALVAMAWPRLRASIAYLPVDTALARHWSGTTPPPDQLAALSERATRAIDLHDHYRYRDGLSILAYLRAQAPGLSPDQRRALLAASGEAAIESVRQAPMKPAGWLRVALARQYLGEAPASIAAPLLMSVYTGRVEPTLQLLRLAVLYDLQRHLDDNGRRLLLDQTLLTWQLQPRELVREIRSGRIPYDRIAGVLARAHPGVLGDIDEVMRGTVR